MRAFHRILSLFLACFALYLGVTGSLIQLTDLKTLLTDAPAIDPNRMGIREGLDGTADFQVILTSDYTAPTLPASLDIPAAFARVMTAARAAVGIAPLQYVELRVRDGVPVGQARSDARLLIFDAETGALRGETSPPQPAGGTFGQSTRNTFKGLHRMTAIGDWTLTINVAVGVGLVVLLVTGFVMYIQVLRVRWRIRRRALFWSQGGLWRSLHRAVAVLTALVVLIVASSGTWLAIESLGRSVMSVTERQLVARGVSLDGNGPLEDRSVPSMLKKTLAAYRLRLPDTPARVVRLRSYGGMQQGVVISGENEARQWVFDASGGKPVSETETGYPYQHFPLGWQVHQWTKQVHRGDMFGMTGRAMNLLAGCSLLYLAISGVVMYWQMWRKRRQGGRGQLFWK